MLAKLHRVVTFGLLAVLLAGAAGAGGEDQGHPAALVTSTGGHIEWLPLVDADSIVLALADPAGEVRTVAFGPGELPMLDLVDTEGQPLPDGGYMWELRLARARTPELRRAMEAAESRGDYEQLARLARLDPPLRQSGYFTLENGLVATASPTGSEAEEASGGPPDRREALVAADQIVPENLIIDGRACIGLRCSSGENFFGEALRLKQSVVRLRFEDTSNEPFPSRDWQLVINDSGSGGGEWFAVQDITFNTFPLRINGAAPSDSFTISGGTGNVGLGLAAPGQDLHIASAALPTIRLEQMGAPARTWDMGVSNTGFFLRDVTGSSALPLQVAAGAPNNSIHVGPTGNLGVGTASPTSGIHVARNLGTFGALLHLQNNGGIQFILERTDSVGTDWQFANFGPSFQISTPGVTPAQFNLTENGQLTIGGIGHAQAHFFIGSNERVGIGTVSPASKLHVNNGDIRVTGGSFIGAPLNPPDYVFAPDYPLPTLQELSAFIERERHLPNVPSGEEIKREGLDLSEFQMRLLEKIEELTLYVIAQDEAIRRLQGDLDAVVSVPVVHH